MSQFGLGFWALLVATIGAIYFGFGMLSPMKSRVIEIAFAALIFFASTASLFFGGTTGVWIIIVALIAHGFWDLLHMGKVRVIKTKVPRGYPLMCVIVDWLFASGLVAFLMLRG